MRNVKNRVSRNEAEVSVIVSYKKETKTDRVKESIFEEEKTWFKEKRTKYIFRNIT